MEGRQNSQCVECGAGRIVEVHKIRQGIKDFCWDCGGEARPATPHRDELIHLKEWRLGHGVPDKTARQLAYCLPCWPDPNHANRTLHPRAALDAALEEKRSKKGNRNGGVTAK